MNAAAPRPPPTPPHSRRAIAAHFAGRTSPAREAAMRAHLPACASCRRHYDRHLILARLDPRALPAQRRIAGGLGLGWPAEGAPMRKTRYFVAGLLVPVVAAAAFALLVRPRSEPSHGIDMTSSFATRGVRPSDVWAPSLWTYRVAAGDPPRLADRTIGAGDELAFAYSNPAGKAYVMIFGVDEHRHVYWFHPAWPSGQPAPVAIRASAGPGPHELSDAIRHAMDGRRLNVYAVFSERAIAATTVEARVRAATGADALPSLGDGVIIARHVYEVIP